MIRGVFRAKEAFQATIAAKAEGNTTNSPQNGALREGVMRAKTRGILVVFFNTDEPTTSGYAFVGIDLLLVGYQWTKYLVEKKYVKSSDKVWMPVEVPGVIYQTTEIYETV